MHRYLRLLSTLGLFCLLGSAFAYDGIVEKQRFTIQSFTTTGGKTIRDVCVGYETYGKLNSQRDNVILVTHFFSGNSHAAGKYRPEDKAPGYWDALIGAGKALDTDRYFVIATDALANLNAKDPNTFTSGPASINPDTGKPYGLDFPLVTVEDMVISQKALLDHLGIRRLVAVAGPSGGSAQALQWAATYPEMVERVIAVIPFGLELHAHSIAEAGLWAMPIILDPKWNGGNYYGSEEPTVGLAQALRATTFSSASPAWVEKMFGRRAGNPESPPRAALKNAFAAESALLQMGKSRAATVDANHFLYTVKAYQLFSVVDRLPSFKAEVLMIPASSDKLFPPEFSRRAVEQLRAAGKYVEYFVIEGDGGHFDGLARVTQASDVIQKFLKRKPAF